MNIGEDAVFVTPPLHIAMDLAAVKSPFSQSARKLYPTLHTDSDRDEAFWEFHADGAVRLVWTTGFSGVTVTLAPHGEALTGSARTFWDFGRPT